MAAEQNAFTFCFECNPILLLHCIDWNEAHRFKIFKLCVFMHHRVAIDTADRFYFDDIRIVI